MKTQYKPLQTVFQKALGFLVRAKRLEPSTAEALEALLEKAIADPTNGGKLVPVHIVDKNGHHTVRYHKQSEIGKLQAHPDHHHVSQLKEGDRFTHPKNGAGTITKVKGHDGKGYELGTTYDSGKKSTAYVHNVELHKPDHAPLPKDEKADLKRKVIGDDGDDTGDGIYAKMNKQKKADDLLKKLRAERKEQEAANKKPVAKKKPMPDLDKKEGPALTRSGKPIQNGKYPHNNPDWTSADHEDAVDYHKSQPANKTVRSVDGNHTHAEFVRAHGKAADSARLDEYNKAREKDFLDSQLNSTDPRYAEQQFKRTLRDGGSKMKAMRNYLNNEAGVQYSDLNSDEKESFDDLVDSFTTLGSANRPQATERDIRHALESLGIAHKQREAKAKSAPKVFSEEEATKIGDEAAQQVGFRVTQNDVYKNGKGFTMQIPTRDRGPRTDHGGGSDGDDWADDNLIDKWRAPYEKKYAGHLDKMKKHLEAKGFKVSNVMVDYGEKGHISLELNFEPTEKAIIASASPKSKKVQ